MKKKLLLVILPIMLIVGCIFASVMFVSAAQEVVFVDQSAGNDTNDGKSATSAVKTLDAAYKKIGDGDGTIVLCSEYALSGDYTGPAHKGTVTITSKYNGTQYDAQIWNKSNMVIRLNGSTVFKDVTFIQSYRLFIAANFNPIVFDTGIEVKTRSGSGSTDLCVTGGFHTPKGDQMNVLDKNPNITINSGTFNFVVGFTNVRGDGTCYYTGTATINMNGGSIKKVYGASVANHASGSLIFNMNGGKVTELCTGGDVTRRLDGSATVNLYGGEVTTLNFNNVIGDGLLNVMGTAPKNLTLSYASDSLKESAEKAGSQKRVLYNSLLCSETLISKFKQYFDAVDNTTCVYVGKTNGSGMSADSPTNSFKKAYEMLKVDGGTIIVDGEVTCDLTESTEKFGGKIIVMGKDANSVLKFNSGHQLWLGTDTVFDSIKLKSAGDATIISEDKALTVNENVATEGFFYVRGAIDKEETLTGDIDITLNGGTFKNVIGVDKNSLAFVGNISIILGGANVDYVTLSDNESVNTKISKATLAISAGEVKDVVTCDKGKVLDSLSAKILGGKVTNFKLKGAEKIVLLNLANLDLANPITAEDIGNDASQRTLFLRNGVDEKLIANIKSQFSNSKNGNMVYVADGGTGNGASPDSPMADLNAAIKALGGEGSVVICGHYTINSKLELEAYSYPVTITSLGTDSDYRLDGAAIELNANIFFGGETTLENLVFKVSKGSIYIYANAHKTVIGDNVKTELTQANESYIGLCGGRTDGRTNKVIDLTVNSGDWGLLRGGSANTGLYENGVDIKITVNGGAFHRYVALSSRGNVNGKITFTANGGTFYQGVYAVYEEDGASYKLRYDVVFNLNGGEFHQDIAPARSASTRIDGSYTVNVNGGEYAFLTDLYGTEKFSGGMTSVINIADNVDINKKEEGTVTFQNPIRGSGPDPWVFYYNGYYYYTHTTGKRIVLMKVAHYADITTAAETVIIDPTEGQNMWSPEIHHFSAEEVGAENAGWYLYIGYDDGTTANQRQHVLKCLDGDNLMGRWGDPVTGELNKPRKVEVPNAPHYNNDELCGGSSKIVINGKTYMTFVSEVGRGTKDFHQTINITEIENPWTYTSVPTTIIVPTYSWEMGGYGTDGEKWWPKVVEGASAVYGDNGEVYLMYTGSGYWTTQYQLGFMKFLGGDPLNASNWKKNPTSVLSLSDEVNGCGHGSYFRDHDGNYYVAYHGYLGKDTSSGRYAHIERIYVTADGIKIGNGSGHPAPLSTVYTVSVNPMPLAEKISGFVADKKDDSFYPNFNNGNEEPSDTTPVEENNGGISTTTAIIIIAAIVLVGAGVCAFVIIGSKKNKKSAAEADSKPADNE